MPLTLFVDDTCPKCRKTILQSYIEPHPTRRDLALHKLDCVECGAVKTEVILLGADIKPAPFGLAVRA